MNTFNKLSACLINVQHVELIIKKINEYLINVANTLNVQLLNKNSLLVTQKYMHINLQKDKYMLPSIMFYTMFYVHK